MTMPIPSQPARGVPTSPVTPPAVAPVDSGSPDGLPPAPRTRPRTQDGAETPPRPRTQRTDPTGAPKPPQDTPRIGAVPTQEPEHRGNLVQDARTGKFYEPIPKTEMGPDGKPKLQVDIDDIDMNASAERFLAHLRVPPDRDEMLRLREERAERVRAQNREYQELQNAIQAEEDAREDAQAAKEAAKGRRGNRHQAIDPGDD